MSKKDYVAIAAVLKLCRKACPAERLPQAIYGLANLFRRENPRFDSRRFLDAAGLPR